MNEFKIITVTKNGNTFIKIVFPVKSPRFRKRQK